MKIKPLRDQVLIEPLEEEKTPSGIVVPESAKEKPQRGKVVAVGPGRKKKGKRISLGVKVGDKVIYKKWGGSEVKVKDKEYLLVSEEDILAVIE